MSSPLSDALQRAERFLAAHGSPLDRARLAVAGGADASEARAGIEALQQADGAFAPLPGRAGRDACESTAAALLALVELRVQRAASLERAVAFLADAQADDGSWGEGDAVARLAPTGRIGAVLARTVYARPEVLEAAGDFLGRHFAPEHVEGGSWDALAGVAAFFSNVHHERGDDVLQWCGRALEKGLRGRTFSAARSARVLVLCDAGGLPGAALDPTELVLGILSEQTDDGGWPVEEPGRSQPGGSRSGSSRVEATLDAAVALARLGAALPRG